MNDLINFSFQGWSMLSFGASKVANQAKDNVSRYGNLAGQKVMHKQWQLPGNHFILYDLLFHFYVDLFHVFFFFVELRSKMEACWKMLVQVLIFLLQRFDFFFISFNF